MSAFGAAARKALAEVAVAENAPVGTLTTALSAAINGVTVTGLSLKAPVVVTATCAGPCAATPPSPTSRSCSRRSSYQGGVTDKDGPFQAGPQGLPLKSDLLVPTTTTWACR